MWTMANAAGQHKREFTRYNCGFNHDPESIVRSQWQFQSKSRAYLSYRWLFAAFVVTAIIVSMCQSAREVETGTYFIYLTHWAVSLNMIVGMFGAILVTIWHFDGQFQGIDKIISWDKHLDRFFPYQFDFVFRKSIEKPKNANRIQNLLGFA